MNYIIIIEGPDNLGKSTLIKQIAKQYNIQNNNIQHFTSPKTQDPYHEYRQIMFEELDVLKYLKLENDRFIIWDRSPFGEYVYAKQRGYEMDYLDEACERLAELKNIKIFFILVYGNSKTLDKFYIKPKNDEILTWQKREKINEIANDFVRLGANIIEKTHNVKVLMSNSNEYNTLDERNLGILDHINRWL